jgi:GAF domain-containing protein
MTTVSNDFPGVVTSLAGNVAEAGTAEAVFTLVDVAAHELIGHRLCTIMTFDAPSMQVRRIYSNNPEAYPPGVAKAKRDTWWGRHVLEEGHSYIGYDADDIRAHFADFEIIFGLGCESILNTPVRLHGRTLGTMNLLNEANFYSEADAPVARVLAGHLAASLISAR